VLRLFQDLGMTVNPDPVTPGTFVVDFPFAAPEGAITRKDFTALQQLEYWKSLKVNFTEHNPSATIYVKEDEWVQVGAWVDANWKIVGGLSFLQADDHVYPLAPYEEITKEQYEKLMETFPQVDDDTFAELLTQYETDDNTTGATEYACVGGVCELAA
jgi:hypothetical protein